jgi:hypothetical protein
MLDKCVCGHWREEHAPNHVPLLPCNACTCAGFASIAPSAGTDNEVQALATLRALLAPFDRSTRLRMFTWCDDRLESDKRKGRKSAREREQLEQLEQLEESDEA